MTATSSRWGFALALAFALLVAGPGPASAEESASETSPAGRWLPSDATARPIVCAPRRGSPAGAAAGFGLVVAASAALSRRRTDRLR